MGGGVPPSGYRGFALGWKSTQTFTPARPVADKRPFQELGAEGSTRLAQNMDVFLEPKGAAPPKALALFDKSIGGYSPKELNAAAMTILGEMSPNLHSKSGAEAKAIASTIFNRAIETEPSRARFAQADAQAKAAKGAVDAAAAGYEAYTRAESANLKQLRASGLSASEAEAKFKEVARGLKTQYEEARAARNAADEARTAAYSRKSALESFVSKDQRSGAVTLVEIVEGLGDDNARTPQYAGTATGKEYFADYPQETEVNKRSLSQRWEIAKEAVKTLAANPSKADKYLYFVAVHQPGKKGPRSLEPHQTRIGGNDFSWTKFQ